MKIFKNEKLYFLNTHIQNIHSEDKETCSKCILKHLCLQPDIKKIKLERLSYCYFPTYYTEI